jgi:hypothetical protein
MPIRSMGTSPDFNVAITLSGLLLVPTLQVRGQYRRVGLFESRVSRGSGDDDGNVGWGVLANSMKELDEKYYEAMGENGKFTIAII